MAEVVLKDICKIYDGGDDMVVDHFNMEIHDCEFVVLVGPSGCGKSTTLRMVAGLEDITRGDLLIDGERMNSVAPKDRNIAMVFQNYALYPHMSVFDNMGFGLKIRKMPKEKIKEEVHKAAELLQLTDFLHRKPKTLSGGQRQRVAVGRAIVRHPKVFLFDEPLSNLDAKLRGKTRAKLSELHNTLQATMIYVTHDQVEAMTMGDRIVVMNKGLIQQIGTPLELYNFPKNRFVATFIGSPPMNILSGILQEKDGSFIVVQENAQLKLPASKFPFLQSQKGKDIFVGIRPEDADFKKFSGQEEVSITAQVKIIEPLGAETHAYLEKESFSFIVRTAPENTFEVGESVTCYFDTNKLFFFDYESEQVIQTNFT